MKISEVELNVWYTYTLYGDIHTYYLFNNIHNYMVSHICIQNEFIYRHTNYYKKDVNLFIEKIKDIEVINKLNGIVENQIFK